MFTLQFGQICCTELQLHAVVSKIKEYSGYMIAIFGQQLLI